MKKDIHPKYYNKTKAKCSCGAVFEFGSTKESTETEICSQCHPFYTGKEKIIETGQVERFRKRLNKKQETKPKKRRKSRQISRDSNLTSGKKVRIKKSRRKVGIPILHREKKER